MPLHVLVLIADNVSSPWFSANTVCSALSTATKAVPSPAGAGPTTQRDTDGGLLPTRCQRLPDRALLRRAAHRIAWRSVSP